MVDVVVRLEKSDDSGVESNICEHHEATAFSFFVDVSIINYGLDKS